MKHRERVLTALNHQNPIAARCRSASRPNLPPGWRPTCSLKGQGLHNPHGGGNTYELERALDEDMLLTSVGWVNGYYQDGLPECRQLPG